MNFKREKFKELRLRRSLTQKEVAKACGVTDAMVAKWEKGSNPDPDKIKFITKILACRVSDLFDISDFTEIDVEREQVKREHHGADVYDDIALMESLELELSTLKKSDPDYHDKRMGFEHQIELCKAEIARKEKEAMAGEKNPPAVSIHGNMNAVGNAAMVLPDYNPYTDSPTAIVEAFRRSALDAVMASEKLDAESKIIVYNLIKDLSYKGE